MPVETIKTKGGYAQRLPESIRQKMGLEKPEVVKVEGGYAQKLPSDVHEQIKSRAAEMKAAGVTPQSPSSPRQAVTTTGTGRSQPQTPKPAAPQRPGTAGTYEAPRKPPAPTIASALHRTGVQPLKDVSTYVGGVERFGYQTKVVGLQDSRCRFCGAELNFRITS